MKNAAHPFCLIATICLGTAVAQTATDQTSAKTAAANSPVAYVYVSRPTHVDGFAASSSGKLTAVPGSPFAGISVSHMSVTKKYLFGAGDDQQNIYTFSIAANGAIEEVAETNILNDAPDAFGTGPIRLDGTGSTLYNYIIADDSFVQSFKVQEDGGLLFLGDTETDSTFDVQEVAPTMISFLGNNKFAYETGCDQDELNPATEAFKRETTGTLEFVKTTHALPKTKSSSDVYCPYLQATDPTDHLALAIQAYNENSGETVGPIVLAAYTADSDGNLSTKSTFENMPALDGGIGSTMSISPSGKLLAVSEGRGFQVFHFNGAEPITHDTGLLHSSESFLQFAWDSDNHLYALSTGKLHVYEATTTTIKEVSGSPYSIPEASSVIVLSLK